jgi:hypothetical protein
VVSVATDNQEAAGLIAQLRAALLPQSTAHLALADVARDLEQALLDRQADLAAAASLPGATATSVVRAVIERARDFQATRPTPGSTGASGDTGAPIAETDAHRALSTPAFNRFSTALAALNLNTTSGQIAALALGFAPDNIPGVRVLVNPSQAGDPLALRREALGTLSDLRPFRWDFFNFSLRVDTALGAVRPRMHKYYFVRAGETALFERLMALDLASPRWIGAPNGYLAWRAADNGQAISVVDERDYNVIPAVVTGACAFKQRALSALGVPASLPPGTNGYSLPEFATFYVEHIERARTLLSLEEQLKWLREASGCFEDAMVALSAKLKAKVYTPKPADCSLNEVFIPKDSGAVPVLVEAQRLLDDVRDKRAEFASFLPTQGTSKVDTLSLPLLSAHAKARKPGPTKGGEIQDTSKRPPDDLQGGGPKSKSPKPTPDGGLPPGSMTHSFTFLERGKYLLISGWVWNTPALKQYLGLGPTSPVCWSFLLFAGTDKNRPSRCAKWGKAGHESAAAPAHLLAQYPNGLPLDELRQKFARPATDDEKKLVSTTPPAKGAATGRGRGRGVEPPQAPPLMLALPEPPGGGGGEEEGGSFYGDQENE